MPPSDPSVPAVAPLPVSADNARRALGGCWLQTELKQLAKRCLDLKPGTEAAFLHPLHVLHPVLVVRYLSAHLPQVATAFAEPVCCAGCLACVAYALAEYLTVGRQASAEGDVQSVVQILSTAVSSWFMAHAPQLLLAHPRCAGAIASRPPRVEQQKPRSGQRPAMVSRG